MVWTSNARTLEKMNWKVGKLNSMERQGQRSPMLNKSTMFLQSLVSKRHLSFVWWTRAIEQGSKEIPRGSDRWLVNISKRLEGLLSKFISEYEISWTSCTRTMIYFSFNIFNRIRGTKLLWQRRFSLLIQFRNWPNTDLQQYQQDSTAGFST